MIKLIFILKKNLLIDPRKEYVKKSIQFEKSLLQFEVHLR
jgi:hypothetical protein